MFLFFTKTLGNYIVDEFIIKIDQYSLFNKLYALIILSGTVFTTNETSTLNFTNNLKLKIMSTKRNGLLALLGLGAVAFWKYKNSTPEEKQVVKDKLNNAKENFNKFGSDLKSKASEVASQVQNRADQTKTAVNDSVNQN